MIKRLIILSITFGVALSLLPSMPSSLLFLIACLFLLLTTWSFLSFAERVRSKRAKESQS